MGDWLAGAEIRPIGTLNGGSWAEDDPDRVILHTTEGDSIDGALATWASTRVPSHLVYDASIDRLVQCLSLNVSAYAVKNLPGGVETNRVGRTIQIELVGHAADSPNRPLIELQRIGNLLRRIRDEGGVDFQFVAPEFVGPEAGTIATVDAPQRFSFDAWRAFNGVCGHQHVPENDHWDPGHLDIATILAAASGGTKGLLMALSDAEQVELLATVRDIHSGNFLHGGDLAFLRDQLDAAVVRNLDKIATAVAAKLPSTSVHIEGTFKSV